MAARMLAGAFVRRAGALSRSTPLVASRVVVQQLTRFSSGLSGDSNAHADVSSGVTRTAADSDTHEDFLPTRKILGENLEEIVERDVKVNPVLIYMKGQVDAPRCGFSALAVKVLQQYGVPIADRDILSDQKLKESVKAYTNWPTFPQIFIKGEFIGGSDIILSMHQKGELKALLEDIAHKK